MLIKRLVTKNLHRLMVFGILACLILDISFIYAYMPRHATACPYARNVRKRKNRAF